MERRTITEMNILDLKVAFCLHDGLAIYRFRVDVWLGVDETNHIRRSSFGRRNVGDEVERLQQRVVR